MAFAHVVSGASHPLNATRAVGVTACGKNHVAHKSSTGTMNLVGLFSRRKSVRFASLEYAMEDTEHTNAPVPRPMAEKLLEQYGQFLAAQQPEDLAEFVKHPCFYPENALGLCNQI